MAKVKLPKRTKEEFEENMRNDAQHLREHAHQMSPEDQDERRRSVLANYLLSQNPNLMQEIFDEKPDEVAKREIKERLEKERRERELKKQSKGRMVDVEDFDLGMKRPKPFESVEDQSAYIRDNVLKRDPLFKVLSTASGMDVEANPEKAVSTLASRTQHYSGVVYRMEEWGDLGDKFKSSLNAMLDTGTGVNFFGRPRSANSAEYNNMTAAIARISDDLPENEGRSPEQKAADIAAAVEATKTYLSDKMTPRRTSSGKVRFEQSMKFLQAAMPPEEFKEYCNEVNRARGAVDPKNKNHVKPQDFGAMEADPELDDDDLEMGETPGQEAADTLIHRYKGVVKRQDEAAVKTAKREKDKKRAYDEAMAKKAADKQRKADREEYRKYLKKADPKAYKELTDEKKEIELWHGPEFEKRKKDYTEKIDKLAAGWKKSKEAQKENAGLSGKMKDAAQRANSTHSVKKGKEPKAPEGPVL